MSEEMDLDKTRFKQRTITNITSVEKNNLHEQEIPSYTTTEDTIVRTKNSPIDTDITQFSPKKINLENHEKTRIQSRINVNNSSEANNNIQDKFVLKGRFILEDLLGAGGMGVVYKAKDLLKIEAKDRDPYVAIKVLTDEFKAHPEAFIALQRESRKTQRIAHPNIVTVYDFDRDGDTVFMTMEYLDGKPLDKLIAQYKTIGMPADEVYKIIEGMCLALIYAHAQNIIHSDFKPGNIFVSPKGITKVIDFGIARAVAKVEHREESLDDKTVFDAGNLGALTPAYASLEMLEGKIPDIRDDIYALACIAYELYTGVHPFNRTHADEAKRQKLKPKRISGLKKHQWQAIEQALSFERENRTSSVDIFWENFNKKPKGHLGLLLTVLLVTGVSAGIYYKYIYSVTPALTEEQVRSQIEKQLRVEILQKSLDELINKPTFSLDWEDQLWNVFQDLKKLQILDKNWIEIKESEIFTVYISKVRLAISEMELHNANIWLVNSGRYGNNEKILAELKKLLNQAQNTNKNIVINNIPLTTDKPVRKEDNIVIKSTNNKSVDLLSEFTIALNNVKKQINCTSAIDMKDFEIAVNKLKSINIEIYKKEESSIVQLLGSCIQKISLTFPERAEILKMHALRIFIKNEYLLGITILPIDPCNKNLAGLGARGLGSTCKDKLSGASKSPYLVVIPGRDNLKTFAISKYEISNDEMSEYCNTTKLCENTSDPFLPATNLSITQVNGYIKWLSEKSGYVYRLPNLTEWQYAARSTNATPDPNRNCRLNSRGIQKGNALTKITSGNQNPWGLLNHLGNAREIVTDRGGKYLAVGGSYETEMENCTFLDQNIFDKNDKSVGFRVLRELKNI